MNITVYHDSSLKYVISRTRKKVEIRAILERKEGGKKFNKRRTKREKRVKKAKRFGKVVKGRSQRRRKKKKNRNKTKQKCIDFSKKRGEEKSLIPLPN